MQTVCPKYAGHRSSLRFSNLKRHRNLLRSGRLRCAPPQLPAGSFDLAPLALAELHVDAASDKDVTKTIDGIGGRSFVGESGDWIVGNHIEQHRAALQEFDELLCVLGTVVDFGEQNILECQPAAGGFEVPVGCGEDVGEARALVGGDNFGAKFVVWSMERHGELICSSELRQPVERFGEADRGN